MYAWGDNRTGKLGQPEQNIIHPTRVKFSIMRKQRRKEAHEEDTNSGKSRQGKWKYEKIGREADHRHRALRALRTQLNPHPRRALQ